MAGRIDAEYQQLKDRTHRWVVERLDEEGVEVSQANSDVLVEFVRNAVGQHIALNRVPLSTQDLNQLSRDTLDEVMGFGPLEPLLADPKVNDILVNGPDSVFIEVAGVLQKAPVRFINDDHVIRVIRRMLAPLGRRITCSTRSMSRLGFSLSMASAISASRSSAETTIGRMPFLKQLL